MRLTLSFKCEEERTDIYLPSRCYWKVTNSVSQSLFVYFRNKEVKEGGTVRAIERKQKKCKASFLGSHKSLEELGCPCNHSLRQLHTCPEQKWRHKKIRFLMGLSWSWGKTCECLNIDISCLGSSSRKKPSKIKSLLFLFCGMWLKVFLLQFNLFGRKSAKLCLKFW